MSSEPPDHVSSDQIPKEILDTCLKDRKEEEFISHFDNPRVKESYKNAEITKNIGPVPFIYTYLQYCCSEGLVSAAKCLISSGADLNKTTNDPVMSNWPPLRIACFKGFADLIETILDESPTIHEEMVLECFKIVIKNYKEFINEKKDRSRSFRLILEYIEKKNIDIRPYRDILGNTHLLYALLYANEEVAFRILEKGVFWGSKNQDVVTIEAANALVVKHHLNNCVSIKKGTESEPEKITATFNYENWISFLDRDCETDGFFYMSNVKRFKHLLNSPLILCFLFLKWRHMRWLYYLHILLNVVNIILIGMFVVSVYYRWPISKITFCSVSSILCSIRIVYQCVLCYQYFRRKSYSWNVLAKLAYSLAVLIILWVCASHDNNTRTIEYKILLSLITILESLEAVLLSRVMSYHGEMFKIVFINFCKVFLCYIILILAFSLGYHVIFAEDNNEMNDSFYAVFNLLLGNTVDNNEYKKINFANRMILLFFIFVFAIVFINLLNGLAVNEIGYLIQEAELVTLKETIHYIHSIEMLYLFFGKSYKLFKGKERVLEGSINERDLTEASYLPWRGNNSLSKDIILKLNELFPDRSIFSCTITYHKTKTSIK